MSNAKVSSDDSIAKINAKEKLKKNVANITKGKDKIMKNINNVRQIINKGTNKVAASIGMDKLFKNYAYPYVTISSWYTDSMRLRLSSRNCS